MMMLGETNFLSMMLGENKFSTKTTGEPKAATTRYFDVNYLRTVGIKY